MKPRTTLRTLLAAAVVASVTLVPGVASADNHCTFRILPSPGWRGATATMEGFNMSPNHDYVANFNGENKAAPGAKTNSNGYFKVTFTIPMDAPASSNWYVYDSTAEGGCQMNDSRNYTVLATAPTTTTTTAATTTTTTTLPPTTTTVAPTTTVAAETTTTAAGATTTTAGGEETTTTVADTTTTTVAEDGEDGGGIPAGVLYVVIGVLAAGLLFFVGKSMGNRRK